MGTSKTQLFSEEQNRLADMARALAHPARIAILEVLAKRQSCICNDIVDEIPLAQPTISQHLKELKKVGLIKGDIDGTSICYCLDSTNLPKIKTLLETYFIKLEKPGNCC